MPVLPMFPLGSVLLPSVFLPLHVFEPRFREMTQACLAGDREFGVVLIERGSEVGGGEVRESVGTVARILEAVELPDGRWALGAIGTRRIRVLRWLEDDPYPQAEVEDWDDPVPTAALTDAVVSATALLRRVLARAAELGDPAAPSTQELSDDPVLASYQLAALGPFGPSDQLALLAASSAEERVATLRTMLAEEEQFLMQRLALSDAGDPDGFGDAFGG